MPHVAQGARECNSAPESGVSEMIARLKLAGALAAVLLSSAAGAQTHDERFHQAFGDEANKVAKTASRQDDIELAERILKTATEPGDPAPFRAFLCRKAAELAACDASGCCIIRQAACLCAALEPGEAETALRSANTAFDAIYRRTSGAERTLAAGFLVGATVEQADRALKDGNASQAVADYKKAADLARTASPGWTTLLEWRLARAQAMQQADTQIAQLRKALEADPKNAKAATELVNLQLTGKDDPSAAAKTAKAHELAGEFLSNLELAATEPNQLNEAQALALCEWYRQQAKGCAGRAKEAMLRRARTSCLRYLAIQGRKGAQSAKGEMALDEIGRELLPLSGKNSDGWLDLLALADPPRDRKPLGPPVWELGSGGQICLVKKAWFDWLMVPYEPPAEYDLIARFTREQGNDAVRLFCTLGPQRFRCALGAVGNTKAALEKNAGTYNVNSPNNPTIKANSLVNGRPYVVSVQVRAKSIRVFLDGAVLTEMPLPKTEIFYAIDSDMAAAIHSLGVGALSIASFHEMRVKPFAGEGKIVPRQSEQK
jgi:hypothetical protein